MGRETSVVGHFMRLSYAALALALCIASHQTWAATTSAAPEEKASVAINSFALDLFSKAAPADRNAFLCPYGAYMTLVAAYAGARGRTAEEIAAVLRLRPTEAAAPGVVSLNKDILANPGRSELLMATAVWVQQGEPIREKFRGFMSESFESVVNRVDFRLAPESAAERINSWVANATKGLIRELLDGGSLKDVLLLLTNAVYFKGDWASPFPDTATSAGVFTTGAGEDVPAMFMRQTGSFHYTEKPGFQALELPYGGDRLSMVVLLPRTPDGLAGFESGVSEETLRGWFRDMAPEEVSVVFPRFKMRAGYRLDGPLTALGLTDCFRDTADFGGITDHPAGMKISGVQQVTVVQVDEKGTEAAAVTGISAIAGSIPEPPREFRADRPFMFIIRHRPTGVILFVGHVTAPKEDGG